MVCSCSDTAGVGVRYSQSNKVSDHSKLKSSLSLSLSLTRSSLHTSYAHTIRQHRLERKLMLTVPSIVDRLFHRLPAQPYTVCFI